MKMHTGDLLPVLTVTCTDDDAAVDLSTATTVFVIGQQDGAVLFNRAADSFNASGVVTMAWQAGDTDTAGHIYLQVKVTWPGSKPQTFPVTEAVELESAFA